MKYLTYLIYILLYEAMVIGGTGYAVFVLGASGWWWLLAVLFSSSATGPLKWIHGKEDAR